MLTRFRIEVEATTVGLVADELDDLEYELAEAEYRKHSGDTDADIALAYIHDYLGREVTEEVIVLEHDMYVGRRVVRFRRIDGRLPVGNESHGLATFEVTHATPGVTVSGGVQGDRA